MKKIFTTLAIVATCSALFAQAGKANLSVDARVRNSVSGLYRVPTSSNTPAQHRTATDKAIGFEAGEGFIVGSIHGQNGWTVTATNDAGTEVVMGQIISDELPYAGTQSLILSQDSRFPQILDEYSESLPIVGAQYMKADSAPDKVTLYFQPILDGATNYQFSTVSPDGMYYLDMVSPDLTYETLWIADFEAGRWINTQYLFSEDTWYKLEILRDATARTITYKIDDQVIYTRSNVDADGFEWKELTLCHDNAGLATQMSIDNLAIGNATLGTKDVLKESKLSLYPNPATSFVNIKNNDGEKIESITIGDLTGKTVKYVDKSATKIDIQDLAKGVYLVKIKTDKGHKIEKIIKK